MNRASLDSPNLKDQYNESLQPSVLKGKVDMVISIYNCEGDPSHNIDRSPELGVPSDWADRTGTFYCGKGRYTSNPDTAGMVDAEGKVLEYPVSELRRLCLEQLRYKCDKINYKTTQPSD